MRVSITVCQSEPVVLVDVSGTVERFEYDSYFKALRAGKRLYSEYRTYRNVESVILGYGG